MSYPRLFTTPGIGDFAEAVDNERARQLAQWGDQRHPDFNHQGGDGAVRRLYAHRANQWKARNARRAQECVGTEWCGRSDGPHTHTAWDGILLEEAFEAVAESDPAKLRAELVQVAAVCAAWISDIDRRPAAPEAADAR